MMSIWLPCGIARFRYPQLCRPMIETGTFDATLPAYTQTPRAHHYGANRPLNAQLTQTMRRDSHRQNAFRQLFKRVKPAENAAWDWIILRFPVILSGSRKGGV